MQAKYKWLLVPPALALILFLGPLRDPGATITDRNTPPSATTAEPGGQSDGARPLLTNAAMPSAWQVGSTLLGVLLLGGVVVTLLGRARRQSRTVRGAERVLSLRETLRLSPKHSLHLVQFEDRLLLLGAADHAIACLAGGDGGTALGAVPTPARPRHDDDDDAAEEEDGAVPRDMIIPRPPANSTALADFRTLLRRARVAQEQR